MSRHSPFSDASAPDSSDPSQADELSPFPAASNASQPQLTRREQRELERRLAEGAADAKDTAAASDDSTDFVAATDAEFTSEALLVVETELTELPLESVVVREPNLALAAEPAYEQLPTDVSPNTTTTSIPLPSRAALRAQLRAAQATDETTPAAAAAPAAQAPLESPEAERVLPEFVPRTRALPAPAKRVPVSTRSGHHRMRMLAARSGSIVAMTFVALMAVATSIPADALLSSSDVQAAAHQAQKPADGGPAQVINLASGADTITVEQDSFESKSIAEVAAASGIRLEADFTNNPNGTIQWPFAVGVHVGDQFGYRNCAGCSVNHGGQDFNPGLGAPIQSIADGVVSFTEDGEGSLGVHMVIDHMIDGKLVSSVYAHMIHGSMLLKTGDVVKVGQVIGQVGSTGMSTGPHLHFEIRLGGINGTKVDPLVWLRANTN